MIKELDPVVLTEDQPEARLEAGDVGWVVMIHGDGKGFEVGFVTLGGETVLVVTVPARAVRPVGPNRDRARANGGVRVCAPSHPSGWLENPSSAC